MTEYVYMVQLREFLGTNIYKIGKTKQEYLRRVRSYPNGTILLLQVKCNDCNTKEREIIKIFRSKYAWKKELGNEYFQGDADSMKRDIFDIVENKNVECPDGINKKQLKDNLKITQELSNAKFDSIVDNYLQREYDEYNNPIAIDKFEENVFSVLDILLQNCNTLQYMNSWKQNSDKRYDIFKSLALSSSKFINHMNMSKLLRTNDNLFERIKNMQNKDLHEINIKTIECQLIAVREYFKKHLSMVYTNDDLTTLNYDSTCEYNNKSVDITDAEYKYLKTMVRTTKKKPTNVKQAFDFGYLSLRKLVGYDNIHIEEKTERQNKKVVSTKKVWFKNIDNHIEIIKYRPQAVLEKNIRYNNKDLEKEIDRLKELCKKNNIPL